MCVAAPQVSERFKHVAPVGSYIFCSSLTINFYHGIFGTATFNSQQSAINARMLTFDLQPLKRTFNSWRSQLGHVHARFTRCEPICPDRASSVRFP